MLFRSKGTNGRFVPISAGLFEQIAPANVRYYTKLTTDRFFHFYHAELVAGDSLCHTSDISTHKVLVNESLIRKKQIENPVGQSFSHDGMDFVICGVIKDYAIAHVTNEVEPLIIIRETDD